VALGEPLGGIQEVACLDPSSLDEIPILADMNAWLGDKELVTGLKVRVQISHDFFSYLMTELFDEPTVTSVSEKRTHASSG